jgi:hypothetical protein
MLKRLKDLSQRKRLILFGLLTALILFAWPSLPIDGNNPANLDRLGSSFCMADTTCWEFGLPYRWLTSTIENSTGSPSEGTKIISTTLAIDDNKILFNALSWLIINGLAVLIIRLQKPQNHENSGH